MQINIDDNSLAPRYCGIVMDNITVQDSPKWLQNKIISIGLTPINNIVDVTNYILHDIGQPLHAFDYEKIEDQTINVNSFNNLTTLELPSGSNCSIILRDIVEEGSSGENVYFDAVRFLNAETSSSLQDTIKRLENLTMFPLYPNPFSPVHKTRKNIAST